MPLSVGSFSARSRLVVARLVLLGCFVAPGGALAAGPSVQQCIAANESAQDLQAAGKLREARARLASCEATSCPGALREDCAKRVDAIDRAMPTVVFLAKDAAGNDMSAVRVTIDGALLTERLDGRALAVDLGEHLFRFEAKEGPVVMKKLVIHEGEKDRRELVLLDGAAAPPAETGDKPALVARPRSEEPVRTGKTQRTVGVALAGVGVAGVVVGSIFGLVAKSTYDGALTHCPQGANGPSGCGTAGHDASQTAHGQALISTIAFIAGGALVAGGAALFFTAPKESRVASSGAAMAGRPDGRYLRAAVIFPRNGAGVGVEGAW